MSKQNDFECGNLYWKYNYWSNCVIPKCFLANANNQSLFLVFKVSSLMHRRLSGVRLCHFVYDSKDMYALTYLRGAGQNLGLEGNFHLIGTLQSIILS